MAEYDSTTLSRFWSKVDKSGDCWNWTAKSVGMGYGSLMVHGKETRAHRFSWMIEHGEIPEGMFVCHRCDNPSCVRPSHLFLGTPKQNSKDMLAKNRVGRMYGTANPQSKLTDEQVREIRREYSGKYGTQVLLAKKYHVSKATMCQLLKRQLWSHI